MRPFRAFSGPAFFGTARALLSAVLVAGGLAGCVPVVASSGKDTPSQSADQLSQLTVATAGSMRGYSRTRFAHWRSAGENCDVRDTVLGRDGRKVRRSGCNVVGGEWFSVYDGKRFTDPALVDVDHMVPLANAWRTGAAKWTDERRADFANDLERPQLIAVSAASNRAKGDQDPAQWKPQRREVWCRYAQDWVAVKHHWQLSVTTAEKAALTDMLESCT